MSLIVEVKNIELARFEPVLYLSMLVNRMNIVISSFFCFEIETSRTTTTVTDYKN